MRISISIGFFAILMLLCVTSCGGKIFVIFQTLEERVKKKG